MDWVNIYDTMNGEEYDQDVDDETDKKEKESSIQLVNIMDTMGFDNDLDRKKVKAYDEDIINQLTALNLGTKSQIIHAINNVNNKKDINDILDYLLSHNAPMSEEEEKKNDQLQVQGNVYDTMNGEEYDESEEKDEEQKEDSIQLVNIMDTLRIDNNVNDNKDEQKKNHNDNDKTWICSRCTFINNHKAKDCEICHQSHHYRVTITDKIETKKGDEKSTNTKTQKLFDQKQEEILQQKILSIVFDFDDLKRNKQNNKIWIHDTNDKENGMKTHYKMIGTTSFCMRGEMEFKYNNIMDYYHYLQTGTDKQSVIGISNQTAEKTKIIDEDHQFIYHKPNIGALSYLFAPRDVVFIRTRFQLFDYQHHNQIYDLCGSLNYSVGKNHPFYIAEQKNYVRSEIIFRSFTLVLNKKTNKTILYYVSMCDLKGSLPKWLVSYNLGNRALTVNKATSDLNLKQFNDSWLDKMKCLKQRKTNNMQKELRCWLNDVVGLPQYFDIFIKNGFENIDYLKYNVTDDDLKSIGIDKKGHRIKLLHEIQKL